MSGGFFGPEIFPPEPNPDTTRWVMRHPDQTLAVGIRDTGDQLIIDTAWESSSSIVPVLSNGDVPEHPYVVQYEVRSSEIAVTSNETTPQEKFRQAWELGWAALTSRKSW